MPRNGSGVMSKPAGTTAVPNTVIESSKYNATIDDIIQDLNTARPIVAGGTGATSVTAAQTSLSVVGYSASQTLTDAQKAQARRNILAPYVAKSSGYTAVADDVGGILRFTNAQTLALTAAATLGDDWSVTVVADGGAVTIDPNASETINGLTTLIIPDGCSGEVVCDGSNFFAVMKPGGYVALERRAFSGVSSLTFTNLGAFRRLRFTGRITASASTTFIWRSSTDNGANYDSGASDYSTQGWTAVDTTTASQRIAASSAGLFGGGGAASVFTLEVDDFNLAGEACVSRAVSTSFTGAGTTIFNRQDGAVRNSTTARNAIILGASSAVTLTGNILVEASVS